MEAHKMAMEAMLFDSEFLSHIMRFYNFVMTLMVRLVDPKARHPWDPVSLPLPRDVPDQFAMLPEWIVQDIVDFFIFLGKYVSPLDPLALSLPPCISNPSL
jgi:ubiquitin conjugation factor E4 B